MELSKRWTANFIFYRKGITEQILQNSWRWHKNEKTKKIHPEFVKSATTSAFNELLHLQTWFKDSPKEQTYRKTNEQEFYIASSHSISHLIISVVLHLFKAELETLTELDKYVFFIVLISSQMGFWNNFLTYEKSKTFFKSADTFLTLPA